MSACRLCIICLGLCCQSAALSEEPSFEKLRYEEDYACLQETSKASPLKCLAVDQGARRYLTLGGEARLRYEYTRDPTFGQDPQDKRGVFLQRYSLLADGHLSDAFRLFAQLNSALENGRNGGPSPVDENKLEFQNAFLEFRHPFSEAHSGLARIGRQEIQLGSGRLVDVREGPNVRRTFDGLRFDFRSGERSLSAFAARPRADRPGTFDDETDDAKALWGLYAVLAEPKERATRIELYYLGFEDDQGRYFQGIADESRHSVGTRFSGKRGAWDFNWEALYQFGSFGRADINAWTLGTETGYSWRDARWRPRLAFSLNIASGDRDADDPDLQTFNPLFPRGNYFEEVAVLGPRNFYNVHTFFTVEPNSKWTLTADINLFWRLETEDGLYSPSGRLIRAPQGSDERFVASTFSLNSEWKVNRHTTLTVIYSHLKPRAFLRDTGPADSTDFIELTAQFKF
jgi:hypothetical protein